MKSAFAIIAVALMIMVAVVPMVGVVSEGASDTTIVDPSTDTNKITIDVAVDNGKTVKVAYGKYSFTAVADAYGAEFVLREASIASVKITVLDDDGAEDTNYPAVTLTNLVAGKTYNATLKAGYESRGVTFQFANDVALYEDIVGTIKAGYAVYSDNTYKTKISEGNFVFNEDGTTAYLVPVGTTGDVYLKVTSFSCSASSYITVDRTAYNILDGSDDVIEAQQVLLTIEAANTVYGEVTISNVVAKYTVGESEEEKDLTFNAISAAMAHGALGYDAYFVANEPTTGSIAYKSVAMKLKADGASATKTFDVSAATSWTLTYTPGAEAFFGQVTMNTSYAQAGTLNATLTVDDEAKAFTANVDEDGYFFKMVNYTVAPTEITGITFTSNKVTYTAEDITSSITAGTLVDVDLTYSGIYNAVTGTVEIEENASYKVAYELLTVTGATTFGSLVTDENGNFAFMAETGKNIIISATGAQLYGDVSVVVGTNSTNLDVTIEAKKITLKVADALGKAMDPTSVKLYALTELTGFTKVDSVTGSYYAYVPANLETNLCVVKVTAADYTFEEDPAFVEGATYKAYEATYSLAFYKADGSALSLVDTTDYDVYRATAYKNSLGSIVYNYELTSSLGASFIAKASAIAVKESDIGTTPVDVIILVKDSNADSKAILKDVYLLNADSTGKISITASGDSLTGKLVRNDGVTGIAGIKAELYTTSSSDTPVDTTYTQADGSFTVYSDLAIGTDYVMKFTDGSNDYIFEDSYAAYEDGAKVTTYKPTKDIYRVSFVDADGKSIELATGNKVTIGGQVAETINIQNNYAVVKYAWTAKSGALAVTLKDSEDNDLRSFQDHTLTAEELATGKITVVSNQSIYTFKIMDAAGNPIEDAKVGLYEYIGDYEKYLEEYEGSDSDGILEILLPRVEDKVGTTYGYAVSSDDGYEFATSVAKITALETDVVSTTGTKVVYFKDATGASIAIKPSTVKVYADGQAGPTATISTGYFSFLATEGVEYTYDIADTALTTNGVKYGQYTFEDEIADIDGIVYANEETVYGSITDAAGNYFGQKVKADVYYVGSTEVQATGVQSENDKKFMVVVDVSAIDYYQGAYPTSTSTDDKYFTFESSETADIKAVETFVPFTFVSANGVTDASTSLTYTVTAVNALGNQTSETVVKINGVKGVVVDVDDVDYYVVKVTTAGDYTAEGTYTTKNAKLVSTVAKYTGFIGTTDGSGDLEYAIYSGSTLVYKGTGTTESSYYTITPDLSLGDKVIVTYVVSSEDDTETYTAVMSNTATYNNLQLVVTASDLKAKIIGGAVYGASTTTDYFTYTLSSDKSKIYLMAINSYNLPVSEVVGTDTVDKLVAQYVFAGWYVNGEKVSKDLAYTVDNVDSNVVMALYEFDGYYEVEKPVSASNSIDPTVLAIGIVAVIIALIAVVYTVIQKKE